MKKREHGVLTVEASIVLTLCILFILFLFGFARVYSAQSMVSHAVLQSADAVALESYFREETLTGSEEDVAELVNRFLGTTSITADSYESLRSADVPKIAKEKFIYAIDSSEAGADEKLKKLGVKDGLAGVDFSASRMDLGNDDVLVYVTYTVELQFPVFGMEEITITKAAKSKTFGNILFGIETVAQDPTMGSASGGGSYKYGTKVQISATPNYGYKFVKWADGSAQQTRTVTVTGPRTYVAIFEPSSFGVTFAYSPKEGGTAIGEGTYTYLSSATITAQPASGYKFVSWTIYKHKDKMTTVVTEPICQLSIDQSYTCTANFKRSSFNISVEVEGISGNYANILYNRKTYTKVFLEYNTPITLNASDVNGYTFVGWKEKGQTGIFSSTKQKAIHIPSEDKVYVAVYNVKPSIKISGGSIGQQTTTLYATTVPAGQPVKWSSSNSNVIGVDQNGKLTAKREGTATITASFVYQGQTYYATKKITGTLTRIKLSCYAYRKNQIRQYHADRVANYVGSMGYEKIYGEHYHEVYVTEADIRNVKRVAPGAWADCPKQDGWNRSSEWGYVFYDGNAKGYYYLYFYDYQIGPGGYYISSIK